MNMPKINLTVEGWIELLIGPAKIFKMSALMRGTKGISTAK